MIFFKCKTETQEDKHVILIVVKEDHGSRQEFCEAQHGILLDNTQLYKGKDCEMGKVPGRETSAQGY